MASLTGQTIASTYDSLLKVSDNGPLTSTYKEIQDGLGNGSGIYVGTGGRFGIGTSSPQVTFHSYGGALTVGNEATYSARFSNNSNKGVLIGYDTTNNRGHIGSINPAVAWTDLILNANGGNVGISVTNPLMKLDLYGTSGLPATSGTTPVGSLRLHASNNAVLDFGVDHGTANGWIQSSDQNGLNNYYGLLLNPRGGNVGIGTSSPNAYSGFTGLTLDNGTNGGILSIRKNGITYLNIYSGTDLANIYTEGGSTNLILGTGGSERMRITSGGNVGIGTTSPVSISGYTTLDVRGTNGSLLYMGTTSTPSLRLIGEGTDAYIDNLTSGGALLFRTNNATERMRITSSGNVGIGNTNPTHRFVIGDGSGTGNQYARFWHSNCDIFVGQSSASILGLATGTGYFIAGDSASYAFAIGTTNSQPLILGTTNNERMRITSGGEVYIAGTTDQGAYNLQVNGTGVWGAGAYVNGSDISLKENIENIDSGLEYINKIRPVKFNYKESYSKDNTKQTGFIAQELQEVFANEDYLEGLVQQGTEHLNVAYQNLIPVLVKAIQELTEKVNQLENK